MTKISTWINTICISSFFLLLFAASAWAGDCPALYEYVKDGTDDNFILKGAFEIVTKAATAVAEFSWRTFAKPLQGVVGLGAAIYVALNTLKTVGSFSQQDTSAYLSNEKTGVIPVLIKAAIIVWLLGNQKFIYEYLIGTVVTTGMEIGTLIEDKDTRLRDFSSPDNLEALFRLVIKHIIDICNAIYRIVASGQLLLCLAFSPGSLLSYYWRLIPMGAAIYIYGWILILGVSFYMFDVLFRLAVGCIMLPMSIACGMSKLTVSYLQKNCSLFMNVSFNFVMFGIILKFTEEMIDQCLGLKIDDDNKVFSQSDIERLSEQLAATGFFTTALCCMIAMQLFMQVDDIVDKVAGGNVGSSGKELGAKMGHAAGQAALKTASGAKDAAPILAAAAQDTGKWANNKVGKPVGKWANNHIVKPINQKVVRPYITNPINNRIVRPINDRIVRPINDRIVRPINDHFVRPVAQKTNNGLKWLRRITRWDE